MDEAKLEVGLKELPAAPALDPHFWAQRPDGSWSVARAFHYDKRGEAGCGGYAPAGCGFSEAEALDLESRRHKG